MPGRATYAALLRGVNVGGRNRVAMTDLRAILESLGYVGVRTYIQSGNAIFRSDETADVGGEQALTAAIRGAVFERLHLDVDVMVRSRDDLAAALAADPFPDEDPKRLLIAFLSEAPSDDARRTFESIEAAPEAARIVGRTAYLDLPNGVGRSVLAPLLERRLGVRATGRNRTTVVTLLAMCDADEATV